MDSTACTQLLCCAETVWHAGFFTGHKKESIFKVLA